MLAGGLDGVEVAREVRPIAQCPEMGFAERFVSNPPRSLNAGGSPTTVIPEGTSLVVPANALDVGGTQSRPRRDRE